MAPFSYRELLDMGKTKTFHRVAIGIFIQSAQQISGINLVSTYANKILQESFGLKAGMAVLIIETASLDVEFGRPAARCKYKVIHLVIEHAT